MKRKALLVGINDYAPVGSSDLDLHGCVNDVNDMASTLNVLGIVSANPGHMRILTNSRAKKAAIMKGLKWLLAGAKKGDVLVFYYSGHGTRVADVSGDEIDHYDEAICPHDFAEGNLIIDDEFRAAFQGIAEGVNLEVIFDSCHSGNATRDLEMTSNPGTPRYLPPPLDWGFFLEADQSIPSKGILKAPKGERQAVIATGLNHVLWAGCRDNQTSSEGLVGSYTRGVFTYSFCKILRKANGNITRVKLDAAVGSYIQSLGYPQKPQLEAVKPAMGEKVFT